MPLIPQASPAAAMPYKAGSSRDSVVIRFAGDSGDGMQLAGMQFTAESALAGNDIATLPDFPAEIRAPAGTLGRRQRLPTQFFEQRGFHRRRRAQRAGRDESGGAQGQSRRPSAQRRPDRRSRGVHRGATSRRAGYTSNPLTDHSLDKYQVFQVDVTKLTTLRLARDSGLNNRAVFRCRNLFVLGMLSWLYQRPIESTERWLEGRFKKTPELLDANLKALKAGYNYGETTEMFASSYQVPARRGSLRAFTATSLATAQPRWASSRRRCSAGRPLFLGSYPITPASDILHELAGFKNFPVYTFQAEDEIAGDSLGDRRGLRRRDRDHHDLGPGHESQGRGGWPRGQDRTAAGHHGYPARRAFDRDADQAGAGRPADGDVWPPRRVADSDYRGDRPRPTASTAAYEAVRIAIKYMTPVILLTDGQLANGAEPWLLPDVQQAAPISRLSSAPIPNGFMPYIRDPETLSRPWAVPGTPGLEHRIGGLSTEDRPATSAIRRRTTS